MLCREVRRVVYFFLDGTLGDAQKQEFNSHLRLCPECESRTQLHTRLRNFVQSRLTRMCSPAPDHLRTRLSRSIRAFRTEWSR